MPLSLKKQRKDEGESQQRDQSRKNARKEVAAYFKTHNKPCIRHLARVTGVPKSTVSVIKAAITAKDDARLRKLISPKKRAGAQRTLTIEEEEMIVVHALWSARRGFAVDADELKSLMARIANDGRARKYKNGVQSDDAVRSFRARYPELTYRRSENKELVKLKGEDYTHVKTYEDALRQVHREHQDIFSHPDFVWNMDETYIDGEYGKRRKVLSPSDSHHGGFTTVTAGKGDGRHIRAVIAVSASGRKAPPFFIIQGKRNMSNWYAALDEKQYQFRDGSLKVLTREGWFPSNACMAMAEKGSMDMEIIRVFMKHLDNFVRQFVPSEKHYLLLLDGHSSRKGFDCQWLEEAKKRNCEVVQSPANTSHFLQPCDSFINKTFQGTVRRVRDLFCVASSGKVDTRAIQTKLMFGTQGMAAISTADIRRSSDETGLWPMNYRFVAKCKTKRDAVMENARAEEARNDSDGPGAALPAVQLRKSDREAFECLATIVDDVRAKGSVGVSFALQKASVCLTNHETISNILMSKARGVYENSRTRVSTNMALESQKPKNVALPAGAPAQYLTHGNILAEKKKLLQEQAAAESAKAEEKRMKKLVAEEKKQERLEKQKRRAEVAALKIANKSNQTKKRRVSKPKPCAKPQKVSEPEAVNALLSLSQMGES